ncbi:MAG: hypothetical protein AB7I50_15925 [Vicinamibacterales bacterium]
MRPFPALPPQLTSILSPEHRDLEQLAARPGEWPALSEDQLLSLLEHCLIVGAFAADNRRWAPTRDLYRLVVERTTADARTAVFTRVVRQLEALQREGLPLNEAFALVPFIEDEPPSLVVSGATISAAVLMGGKNGDPHTGRETVLRFTRTCQEPDRQRAMIQGLLAIGDAAVATELRGCWRPMSDHNRRELCRTATGLPFPSTVEFLLTWAEDALAAGDGEREMCRPISALCALAHVASGRKPAQYGGRGVFELIRNYPAAAFPPDQVIRIGESWSVTQFGARIEKRLRVLAAAEREEPIIAETCLALWGRGGA